MREWRTSASDAGAETGGGYSSENRTVTGEGKSIMYDKYRRQPNCGLLV